MGGDVGVATRDGVRTPPSTGGRGHVARLTRWALFAAVLLAEYLAVSLSFAAHYVLNSRGTGWNWFGEIGVAGHVAILGVV